ncbi:CYTH domain-containing protein [Desertibacillus haloalkaliphilus]|uniref:CYTH domain-containing protein n=1 Tax=Desertibacillus haloalkaliphilus TaxID=1328930 RepID=UPI001C25BDF7|nr:CYTH domain-containing protein [Desertibacillus haloalkaliphilus]MBU8906906.1 CYTH domain-containing protein [Desertibacillus haloalkaliphilus]
MSQEIEIEVKNLITTTEFNRIVTALQLKSSDFKQQINHYFDTADFSLKRHQAALRIREKHGQAILTLKQPHSVGLLETHQQLEHSEAIHAIETGQLPDGEVVKQINDSFPINLNDLSCLGTLTTDRAELPYADGLLVIDKSTYLCITDYEIEYEGKDEQVAKQTFSTFLSEQQIPLRKTDNKIARFFKEKKNQEKDANIE